MHNRVGWPEHFGFEECRRHRGNPHYWRPNYAFHGRNITTTTPPPSLDANEDIADCLGTEGQLGVLSTFVVENLVPSIFESTGKVTVIVNAPGEVGVEHVDHKFEDWVSARP